MIYSIGYQGIPIDKLILILKSHEILYLVDVRSKPTSRNSSYRRLALEKRITREGVRYVWMGNTLGGLKPIEEREIRVLAEWQKDKTICIMCMEADPQTCHRHHEIAERLKPHGVQVLHIIPHAAYEVS